MHNRNIQKLDDIDSLTIVIVLFKEPYELIHKTLDLIKDFKIILIDNDYNKDLEKKIQKNFKIFKYVLNKKNNGFSAGYNQGIRISNTIYTLILGPDCLITKQDIFALVKKFSSYTDAAIVTPTSYNKENKLSYAGGPLPENGEKDLALNLNGDVCVESALGACMLVKTEELKKYNLYFDENLFLYFSDDDLCRRIKSFNKSIIQTIDSKCIHQHGNIKIKNKYLKIYAREFNFTHDQLYYFYKEKNKKYYEIINNFKKKIPSYYLKLTIKLLTFQLTEFVKIYSKLKGYYKFKSRYKS